MAKLSRRNVIVGLGLAATGIGCGGLNPFLLPYMFSGGESKHPAEFPLTPPPKKENAKVVVLAWSNPGLPADLAGVDRMLNAELIRILDARIKENEDEVQVLKMPVIDKVREDNPNWAAIDPYEIGKKFGADYVIDVEIREMDLYKPGSRQFLLGHANVSVSAYDLSKPLKDPAYTQDFAIQYPRMEREVESRAHVSSFRMAFVQRIASDISVKFVDTSPQKLNRVD
jgi:hypothetical protein